MFEPVHVSVRARARNVEHRRQDEVQVLVAKHAHVVDVDFVIAGIVVDGILQVGVGQTS